MGSKFHILLRSVCSEPLAIEHEQSRHDHGHDRNDSDENECVLGTHASHPAGKCKPNNHCETVADKDHGDKSVIEDLNLLVWSLISSLDLG